MMWHLRKVVSGIGQSKHYNNKPLLMSTCVMVLYILFKNNRMEITIIHTYRCIE